MSQSTNSAENNRNENSSTEIIERVKIPWTPFHVVGRADTGYFVAFGRYRLTDTYSTKAEAIEALEKEKWNTTVKVAGLVQEMMIEEEVRKLKEEFDKAEHPHDTVKPNVDSAKTMEAKLETYKEQQDRQQMEMMREKEFQDLIEKEKKEQ